MNTAIAEAIIQGVISSDHCELCGQQFSSIRGIINENHWTEDRWIRVDHCQSCKVTQRPRTPRAQRQPRQIAATDWNMLVAFSKKRSK